MQDYKRTLKNCFLNTGTLLDLATGNFLPGKNNSMILNGGLYTTNSFVGREQTYKSTIAGGYFGRALHHYKSSEGLVWETELSLQGKGRILSISGCKSKEDLADLDSRFTYYDNTEVSLEDMFEIIKKVSAEKSIHMKDYIRETPFIGDDGKPILTIAPTFIFIDSFSAASSSKEISLYADNKLGDSKNNTVAMNDGRLKSEFGRQLPYLCGAKGIYLISTAHVGDKINMDGNPYSSPPKDLPTMRASDTIKRVGTQYSFLSTNMLETRKVTPVQDSKKKNFYPSGSTSSDVELQQVTSYITRCKNNVSGDPIELISSQFYGIQEYLEFHNFLSSLKCNLLEGVQEQKLGIHDQSFNRKNIREYIDKDPTFARALQILAHFAFVRNRWFIPEINNIGYVEFCKMFNASKSLKEEILNSTGVWSFKEDKPSRNYLSIFDIITKIRSAK
jgi:hypothetical protein